MPSWEMRRRSACTGDRFTSFFASEAKFGKAFSIRRVKENFLPGDAILSSEVKCEVFVDVGGGFVG